MKSEGLKNILKKYLRDAGFDADSYLIDDSGMDYVEVFFTNNEAIHFIIEDIEKTEFSNYIEILDYKYKTGIISAIITYREIENKENEIFK